MLDVKERVAKIKHDTLHHLSNLYTTANNFTKEVKNTPGTDVPKRINKLRYIAEEFVKRVDEISLKMIIGEQEVKNLQDINEKVRNLK